MKLPAIYAALALTALLATAAPAAGPAAVLEMVKGPVEVWPAGGKGWSPAEAGLALAAGDRLRTGAKAEARVSYATRPPAVNYVYALSEVTIEAVRPAGPGDPGTVSLNMLKGGAWTRVLRDQGKQGPSFQVRTPNAVAAVSGTGFATGVAADGRTFICSCVGSVAVGNAAGDVILDNCQGTQVAGDRAPTLPVCETTLLNAAMAANDVSDPKFGWCLGCHQQGRKPAGYPR